MEGVIERREGKIISRVEDGLTAEVVVLTATREVHKKGPKKGKPKMKSETRHLKFSYGSWVDKSDRVYDID